MDDQHGTLLTRVFPNSFTVIVVVLACVVFAWFAWERFTPVQTPQMTAEDMQAVMESLEDSTNTQGISMDEARKDFTEERRLEILNSLNSQQ